MVKKYISDDLRKELSSKKKYFLEKKCSITTKTEDTSSLQVDHIVECQAVAVCINLLKEKYPDNYDPLVKIIKDEWMNGKFALFHNQIKLSFQKWTTYNY